MKKKFLSLALALVMCLGLCIPAFAASGASSSAPEINIDLPDNGVPYSGDVPVFETSTYQVRKVGSMALTGTEAGTTLGYVILRSGEAEAVSTSSATLPLGTSITISGLRNQWDNPDGELDMVVIMAFSDPDGDGVYDGWIFSFDNDPPVVPLEEEQVAYPASETTKYNTRVYVIGDDTMGSDLSTLPDTVTLTTDYLNSVFGPNTLLILGIETYSIISAQAHIAVPTGSSTIQLLLPGVEAPAEAESPSAPETPDKPAAPVTPAASAFTDVSDSAYYAAPVAWAVERKITTGTSDTAFSPGQDCTNAQILTFLWRACGEPAPEIDNPFTNTISDAYLQAAIWAYEQGMVSGDTFDASQPCTRAMAVTYIWQACGSPASEAAMGFTDVPAGADYAQAVAWAVEKKVTSGTTDTTFSPDDVCSRGQIVTFLYRTMADN